MLSKVIVFELKRLIPFILLLVLLSGLSLYDQITPEPKKTGVLTEKVEGERALEELEFSTKDEGYRVEPASFIIVESNNEWVQIIEEKDLGLSPDAFNEQREIGVFTFHCEIEQIRLLEGDNQKQVEVIVSPENDFYHVAVMDQKQLGIGDTGADLINWHFVDVDGERLYQITQDP
ncbi:hypothetical protein Nther_1188 [Natranaerobius thermophilus JW/NM-WN-LF]|uniref:DUF4340 domain-containing protein n=1 Tax=Natranaerobius thermophilus (strain ATCC BAA-1301 / DSM 18059 / JW/NM-WN-LF) TaxID=457570 RepID=B2A1N4_NATTJ|nr:hypothetical protein Nther_1188 [Natranaerobius thermophilus JW/NM-WN-LF]